MFSASFDIAGMQALNGLAGRWIALDAVFIFAASGLIFVMAALVVAYVAAEWKFPNFENRVEDAWHVFWAFVLAFGVERLIGFLWFRPRPFVTLDSVVKLIEKSPLEKSFPSGHATAAFVMAFALHSHDKKWGRIMLVLACLVALGRIAVGVHYPSDVIAGAAVGYIVASSTKSLAKRIEPYLDLFPFFRKKA